jgi:hypothetical protein
VGTQRGSDSNSRWPTPASRLVFGRPLVTSIGWPLWQHGGRPLVMSLAPHSATIVAIMRQGGDGEWDHNGESLQCRWPTPTAHLFGRPRVTDQPAASSTSAGRPFVCHTISRHGKWRQGAGVGTATGKHPPISDEVANRYSSSAATTSDIGRPLSTSAGHLCVTPWYFGKRQGGSPIARCPIVGGRPLLLFGRPLVTLAGHFQPSARATSVCHPMARQAGGVG